MEAVELCPTYSSHRTLRTSQPSTMRFSEKVINLAKEAEAALAERFSEIDAISFANTEKIMNAQKARGVDFAHGSLVKRAKALIPILIPLFVSAFRRAEELATAMECRCYRGGKGRTKMRVPHLRFADFVAVFLMLVFGAGVILLNRYGLGFRL